MQTAARSIFGCRLQEKRLFNVSRKDFLVKMLATPLFFFLGHEDQAEHTRGNNSKNEDEGELKKQKDRAIFFLALWTSLLDIFAESLQFLSDFCLCSSNIQKLYYYSFFCAVFLCFIEITQKGRRRCEME